MALSNAEKVAALQEAAKVYFEGLTTLSDWVTFINNVSKANVKTFLQNALQSASSQYNTKGTTLTTLSDDYDSFVSDIGDI